MPSISRLLLGTTCAVLLLACETAAGPGARIAISVAPLALDGIGAARYRLTVVNADDTIVWSAELDSGRYGDGAGALAYVAPCDADAAPNVVRLELLSLEGRGADGATGPLIDGVDFVNPAPDGRPIGKRADCDANVDTAVAFDLTIVRRAAQGFLDVAVEFDDLFCSAKLDCADADGALDVLFHPHTGRRETTFVLGFACAHGAEGNVYLHMDDVRIQCADGTDVRVDPRDGPGNLDPLFGPAPNTRDILFQAATYRGLEALTGPVSGAGAGAGRWHKAFVNVALGINDLAVAGRGLCYLTATATASAAPFAGGLTPPGATWPLIRYRATLWDDDGVQQCARHALDAGPEVATDYTRERSERLDHTLVFGATCAGGFCGIGGEGGALIGPEGGRFSSRDGRAVVDVPVGAVDGEPVAFTITVEDAHDGSLGPVYRVSPDVDRFAVPVRVSVARHAGEGEPDAAVAVWQDGAWRVLPFDTCDAERCSALTTHFSRVAIVPIGPACSGCDVECPVGASGSEGEVPCASAAGDPVFVYGKASGDGPSDEALSIDVVGQRSYQIMWSSGDLAAATIVTHDALGEKGALVLDPDTGAGAELLMQKRYDRYGLKVADVPASGTVSLRDEAAARDAGTSTCDRVVCAPEGDPCHAPAQCSCKVGGCMLGQACVAAAGWCFGQACAMRWVPSVLELDTLASHPVDVSRVRWDRDAWLVAGGAGAGVGWLGAVTTGGALVVDLQVALEGATERGFTDLTVDRFGDVGLIANLGTAGRVVRVGPDRAMRWKADFAGVTLRAIHRLANGHYLVGGRKDFAWLAELDGDGAVVWQKEWPPLEVGAAAATVTRLVVAGGRTFALGTETIAGVQRTAVSELVVTTPGTPPTIDGAVGAEVFALADVIAADAGGFVAATRSALAIDGRGEAPLELARVFPNGPATVVTAIDGKRADAIARGLGGLVTSRVARDDTLVIDLLMPDTSRARGPWPQYVHLPRATVLGASDVATDADDTIAVAAGDLLVLSRTSECPEDCHEACYADAGCQCPAVGWQCIDRQCCSDEEVDWVCDLFAAGDTAIIAHPCFSGHCGAGLVIAPGRLVATEEGARTEITVRLAGAPPEPVSVRVTAGPPGPFPDIAVSLAGSPNSQPGPALTLVFTAQNWNVPQRVAIDGVADGIDEDLETVTVTLDSTVAAPPSPWHGLHEEVFVRVDEPLPAPALVLSGATPLAVHEGGADASFQVRLNRAPEVPVTVRIVPPAADLEVAAEGGTPAATLLLTFQPSQWNIARTVVVHALDDGVSEGQELLAVALGSEVAGGVAPWHGLAAEVAVRVFDPPGGPAIVVDVGDGVSVIEGVEPGVAGAYDVITVALSEAPEQEVTVAVWPEPDVRVSQAGGAAYIAAFLFFTSANWNVPKTVWVYGSGDGIAEGRETHTIRFDASVQAPPSPWEGLTTSITATVDDP